MEPTIEVLELGCIQLPDWHPRSADETCVIRAFVIHHPDGLVLVDTGVGTGSELIDELYRPDVKSIVGALNEAGIDERDVTAIINTHLHFDHCGQNRALRSVPVYVQSAELVAAEAPMFTIPEWAEIEPDRRRVIDGDESVAPGLTILATPGHTPGHQSVLVGTPDGWQQLIVGQACYSCAEFEGAEFDPADLHDESFHDANAESMDRLRGLGVAIGYFSHDQTVYLRPR